MDTKIKAFFSESDQQKIKEAVAKAEVGSLGEVVPCVIGQSSDHKIAATKSFLYAVVISAILLAFYEWQYDLWVPVSIGFPFVLIFAPLLMGILFYFLTDYLPWLKRRVLGKKRLFDTTYRQAKVEFLQNEVFRTKNRTGILIFVSLFEHQVHVLSDKGLHQTVDVRLWDEVVSLIVSGIQQKKAAEGLIAGIEKCGEILRKHSPKNISENDTDELANNLRIGSDL